jgi:hypothetical protein
MRTRFGVVAAVAALGVVVPAQAASATTWDGRCEIHGVSTFDEPIGALPEPATYRDRGTGTCTGTLNGEAIAGEPITLKARGEGVMGCLGGRATMPGKIVFTRGTETEDDDVAFGYVGESAGVFPSFVSLSRGEESGRGIAYVEMLSGGDPSGAEKCRDGTMDQAAWHAFTQTFGPNEG